MKARALVAEALGSAGLLAVVVGSGIMGERLAGGNAAVALLANSIATAFGLFALIVAFAPISGAHFNPVVTLVDVLRRERPWSDLPSYAAAQLAGALGGVALAHAMFGLPVVQSSAHVRNTPGEWLAEFVATFGLVCCIRLSARHGVTAVAASVAAYIGAAYWFTSSTSFANPVVTIARSFTDTFSGIHPAGIAAFIGAQLLGALAGHLVTQWLVRPVPEN